MKALVSFPPTGRSTAIEKAIYAQARALTHGVPSERNALAKSLFPDDRIVGEIIARGAAPLATTTATGFAAELATNLVGDFLATLAPLSAAAQIISRGLQLRMASTASQKLPAREGSPSTAVSWVGEGNPIPVRSYTLNDDAELSPRKFGFIVGVSRETAIRANGETVIRQLIREDAGASLDGAYFSTAVGDTEVHGGMLEGVAALAGYPGADREAMETDLIALSDAVSAAGSGQVAFIVSPKRAARIKIKAPDLNRELLFLPSLAVAETTMIAVDPLSWAHGFGDDFDLDVSNQTAIHMSDEPLPISTPGSPATVADPVRSYWQTDSIAVRFLADVAFAARRPNAAAHATGLTW